MQRHNKKLLVLFVAVFLLLFSVSVPRISYANGSSSPLVETDWLAKHLNDPEISIVFVPRPSQDARKNFDSKHIPGSVYMSIGDLMGAMGNGSAPPDSAKFEALMGRLGISNSSKVVITGASGGNPFTTAAFWLMKYNGHSDVSYLNGGVNKWLKENRQTTSDATKVTPANYKASPDISIFATADDVAAGIKDNKVVILDVRGADEYSGKNAMKNKRAGHVPGAVNMNFYSTNLNQDETFKSVSDLKAAYEAKGITGDKEVITYCQGGVRAAHTFFVLKHLLGYPNVKNYVGSWGEWGNRLDPAKYPVEK
jgi:thiosulfate/3-mercaptopyruvate sulfurtransferase